MKQVFLIAMTMIVSLFNLLGQNDEKIIYLVEPDVKHEKGTLIELYRETFMSKLEEYALVGGYQKAARGSDLNTIFRELSIQQSGVMNENSVVQIGNLTGADFIVTSTIIVTQGYGMIRANLYNAESGILVTAKSKSYTETTPSDFDIAATEVVKKLFGVSDDNVENNEVVTVGRTSKQIPGTNIRVAAADEIGFYTWEDAEKQCQLKGPGWRLPSLAELKLMYSYRDKFDGFYGYNGNRKYWSSERGKRDADYFDFNNGEIDEDDPKDADKCVRCVK